MAARVLTEDDLQPLWDRIGQLEAKLDGRASGDAMSTEQAAARAGVTPKTVRTWVETGLLPSGRRGRRIVIRRADLEAYLAGARPAAGVLLASLTSPTR